MRVKDAVGRFGEQVAVRHVEQQGLEILDRNWRLTSGPVLGELDIVARSGDLLVVVEVKTRTGHGFGSPAEAVGRAKAARIRRLAAAWIDHDRSRAGDEAGRPARRWTGVRFDVIAVVRSIAGVEVEHLTDAF